MKRNCFTLLALALLGSGPVLGQSPPAMPVPAAGLPPAPIAVDSACASPIKTKTVCCPTPHVKEVKKVTYSSGSETICLAYYPGLFRGSCSSGHCEHPIQVRYLVKKVNTVPVETVKCVPTEVPAGNHGHCHVGHSVAAVTSPATSVAAPTAAKAAPTVVPAPTQSLPPPAIVTTGTQSVPPR